MRNTKIAEKDPINLYKEEEESVYEEIAIP